MLPERLTRNPSDVSMPGARGRRQECRRVPIFLPGSGSKQRGSLATAPFRLRIVLAFVAGIVDSFVGPVGVLKCSEYKIPDRPIVLTYEPSWTPKTCCSLRWAAYD